MSGVSREWLRFMREQYPVGSRIKLRQMNDPFAPVESGTMGTLTSIDDIGTFHVNWDNGRTLGLVFGEDSFSVTPPEPTIMKLYMPLTADLYEKDEWGSTQEDPSELDGSMLRIYKYRIMEALEENCLDEEKDRGIMHWYGKEDSVDSKVKSVVFKCEERDSKLWGVAECHVIGTLTPQELTTLKDYISGQASDGWGEGFEQREIEVDDCEMYVHLWNSDDSWSIQTEEECFTPKLAEGLPELCFSTLASTGQLICIKRGETGYYPSEWSTSDKERNKELVGELNEQLGVTDSQRMAMETGSMVGWGVPGADPKAYEKNWPAKERLPEFCYSTHPDDGSIVIIKRGENKFFPTDKGSSDRLANEQLVDELNDNLGLTLAEVKAMNIGILTSWENKGADPLTWADQPQNLMGGMSL